MKNAPIIIIVMFVLGTIIAMAGLVFGASTSLSGTSAGILRSDNGSASWTVAPDIFKSEIETIYFASNGTVYAGTRRDGLWTAGPNGKWSQTATAGLGSGARILDVTAQDGTALAAVFSGNQGRILRLDGKTERELYFTPLSKYAIFGLAQDPRDYRVLRIISTDGGFYESVDGGTSWKSVYRFNEGLVRLIADPSDGGRFWVVTSRGNIYGTNDAGRTWRDLSSGLAKFDRASDIQSVVLDPRSGALYLGTGYGLLRSYDGGVSWQAVPLTIPPEVLPVTAVAVDPRNPKTIYAAAKNQLYVSYDNGESWHGSILPTKRTVYTIAIDPQNGNNILIGLRR
ncbi:MAG: hypothetical protein HZA25_02820 [Candidatus Niyogibacteria bacterium]|nr:hypothetical protein [Candidatus Niyogibacteria bacterium]